MASTAPITFFFIRPSAYCMKVSACAFGMEVISVDSSGNVFSSPGMSVRMTSASAWKAPATIAEARSPSTLIASPAVEAPGGVRTGK